MRIASLHWGLHAWSIFYLAYFACRRDLPLMIRSTDSLAEYEKWRCWQRFEVPGKYYAMAGETPIPHDSGNFWLSFLHDELRRAFFYKT